MSSIRNDRETFLQVAIIRTVISGCLAAGLAEMLKWMGLDLDGFTNGFINGLLVMIDFPKSRGAEGLGTFLFSVVGFILGIICSVNDWKSSCSVDPSPSMKNEYVKLQAEYVAAKASLRSSSSIPFEKLPVFPFSAPYWDKAEETYERITFHSSDSLDAITDETLDEIRDELGDDVLYMCGDRHNAVKSNDNVRALLVIEEVKQSGGELAIVAVVVSKRGTSITVEIRNSAFPNTIHSQTPRRTVFATDKHENLDWSSYETELYYLYFSPVCWNRRGNEWIPEFNQETTNTAESLAKAVYGKLRLKQE